MIRTIANHTLQHYTENLKLPKQRLTNNSTKFFRSSPDVGDRLVYTRTLLDQADIIYQKLG
jgi:hypothetical protein